MFITFEGLDFCGKSTQVELLKEYLENRDKEVKVIREPGGTLISEKVRNILLDRNNAEMVDETELLLFSASRSQLVREIIIPALEKGIYVVSDRFHDSSIVYQGFGRGLPLKFVVDLQNFVIDGAQPDITFFLDIPIEEVLRRKLKLKPDELDRIEVSKKEFYEKVREGYLYLAENEKRYSVIDGQKSIEEINQIIVDEINKIESR